MHIPSYIVGVDLHTTLDFSWQVWNTRVLSTVIYYSISLFCNRNKLYSTGISRHVYTRPPPEGYKASASRASIELLVVNTEPNSKHKKHNQMNCTLPALRLVHNFYTHIIYCSCAAICLYSSQSVCTYVGPALTGSTAVCWDHNNTYYILYTTPQKGQNICYKHAFCDKRQPNNKT